MQTFPSLTVRHLSFAKLRSNDGEGPPVMCSSHQAPYHARSIETMTVAVFARVGSQSVNVPKTLMLFNIFGPEPYL